MILYQAVLPGGRAVRFVELDTAQYLDCEERAHARVIGPDPGSAKLTRERAREHVLSALKFVTDPLPVVRRDGVMDVDATLAEVPLGAWKAVDYIALSSADGSMELMKLFPKPADYMALVKHILSVLDPEHPLDVTMGKARKISVSG